MKKKLLLALTACSIVPAASAQNILVNGGFETHTQVVPGYWQLDRWLRFPLFTLEVGTLMSTPQGRSVVALTAWDVMQQFAAFSNPSLMMVFEAAGRPHGPARTHYIQVGARLFPGLLGDGSLFSLQVPAFQSPHDPPEWRTLAKSLHLPNNIPQNTPGRFGIGSYTLSPSSGPGCYVDDAYLIALNTVAHSGGYLTGVAPQNDCPTTGHPFLTQFNNGALQVQSDTVWKASVTIVGIAPAATTGFSVRWSARRVNSTYYQRLVVYDWTTLSWDLNVAQPSAPVQVISSTMTDYARFISGASWTRYLEPGTGRILARIEWHPTGWSTGPLHSFTAEVDNIRFQ